MTEAAAPATLGVILAGGLARRMGGGDKPLALLGGRPLLDHVIERLRSQCRELILNANGDPARFAASGLAVVPDDLPGFPGPLAGILAALDWAAERRPDIDWVVSVAGDSPVLPADYVQRLHAARSSAGTLLACARTDGRTHPVNGLWSVALRHDLRRGAVEEDMRRIDRWTARHGVAPTDWPTEPVDPFFNVNTPDELAAAERLLSGQDRTP
jgi:molybdopterin-guanine dinucleotide biosynthesis protein A